MIAVHKSDVVVPESGYVKGMLPVGYKSLPNDGNGKYMIQNSSGHLVGMVTVQGDYLIPTFKGGRDGNLFKEAFFKKFPRLNPDRVLWGVFIEWRGVYSMPGRWYESREDADLYCSVNLDLHRSPILCSVRAGDVRNAMKFMTLSSYAIGANGASDVDGGPVKIELTNLEIAMSEEVVEYDLGDDDAGEYVD